jgi:hypothetical protein
MPEILGKCCHRIFEDVMKIIKDIIQIYLFVKSFSNGGKDGKGYADRKCDQ